MEKGREWEPPGPSASEVWFPPFSWTAPGRHEAFVLTLVSLVACTSFWLLGVIDAAKETTSAILASALESMFDVFSTLIVLWRLRRTDALDETPANVQAEQRTSAALSMCTIGIALVLISFAAYELYRDDKEAVDRTKLGDTVTLSFPSAVVYLVIGMLQINFGLMMRVRSIRQDGVISILAAAVGLGALLACLINLMTCEYKEYLDLAQDYNSTIARMVGHRKRPLRGIALMRAIRDHAKNMEMEGDDISIELDHDLYYPYYWVEDVITVFLALIILTLGLRALAEDARSGIQWWRPSFWTEPPPPAMLAAAHPVAAGRGRNEKTPLVKA